MKNYKINKIKFSSKWLNIRQLKTIDINLNDNFRPTEEEFSDPIQYIEALYKEGAHEYGCIKIIPPAGFKPPWPLDKESSNKLPFRFQVLQDMTQGKVRKRFVLTITPQLINF